MNPETSFYENWNGPASACFDFQGNRPEEFYSYVADPDASDGRALKLTLPPRPEVGPGRGPEIRSQRMYRYGSFSSRLKAASCAVEPRAGVVTGFFTFFNNGGDITGCGLPDNSEIDFEWLAAEPQVVHLTMWTNFRESDDAHRKVFREIDLATGTIRKTCYDEVWGVYQPLAGIEAQPAAIQAIPGYNSSTTYYEYGFTWAPNRVTWWIVRPDTGQPMILWDYRGPAARIPTIPAKLMTNVWHTNTWAPDAVPDALQQPATAVDAFVDWTKFSAYP